jgi:hypothetical protein
VSGSEEHQFIGFILPGYLSLTAFAFAMFFSLLQFQFERKNSCLDRGFRCAVCCFVQRYAEFCTVCCFTAFRPLHASGICMLLPSASRYEQDFTFAKCVSTAQNDAPHALSNHALKRCMEKSVRITFLQLVPVFILSYSSNSQ